MRKLIVALTVAVMALGVWCGVAGAHWADLIDQLTPFADQGLESTAEINHAYIDLSNISNNSVVAHTYMGAAQSLTVNTFTVQEQTPAEAMDRITRYIFELSNRYLPDTDLALSGVDQLPTVHAYTYGIAKDEAIWAVVNGLPDCLKSPPFDRYADSGDGDSSGSWVDKYSPEQIESTIAASIFTINSRTYTTADGSVATMDVTPYVKDKRTYTPVRYLAYALGVTEDGIQWDQDTKTVTITKDDTTLKLTIGSMALTKNSEIITMDVAPELIDPGRTMLPARWVSEALGATVTWDEVTQQVTIQIPQPQEQGQ